MSYKKIKVIEPESVRPPEKDYVYLGYGYSSTYDEISPWIKKDDGSIILIGGDGGGGTDPLYWKLNSGYLEPTNFAHKLRVVHLEVGNTSFSQFLNVEGAIQIGTTSTDTKGSIRWTGTDFQGYNGNWVSLTESDGGGGGECYWGLNAQGIIYAEGNVYVGNASVASTDDILKVKGGVTLSDSDKENVGTIRYNTTSEDIEGYVGSHWLSLTDGSYSANNNEFIYNNINDNLVGASSLKYSDSGIGVNTGDPYSSLDVNGSFGTKTNVIISNTTLDNTYHTVICANSENISITLPDISTAINREYVICRYGVGNISVERSQIATQYTEYINFYGSIGTLLNFNTDLPLVADTDNLLYEITIKPIIDYPNTGDATWVVTHFSSVYYINE